MTGHTTSSRIQSTKESPSSSSSCPLLIRCAMVGGALSVSLALLGGSSILAGQ